MTHRLTQDDMGDGYRGWPVFLDHADELDRLAGESERDGLPDNAERLRNDAAWYRARFSPKKCKETAK